MRWPRNKDRNKYRGQGAPADCLSTYRLTALLQDETSGYCKQRHEHKLSKTNQFFFFDFKIASIE